MTSPPTFRLLIEAGAIEGFAAIRAALEGDLSLLARRVRSRAELREDERAFVADLLDGKIKRPAHRPAKASTAAKRRRIAETVHLLEQFHACKREAAVREAEMMFGVGERYVRRALRDLDEETKDGIPYAEIAKGYAALLRSGSAPSDGPAIDVPIASPPSLYPAPASDPDTK